MSEIKEKEYTDEQFEREFPEVLRKCGYCKKKFPTSFNTIYCSDHCFNKATISHRKAAKKWLEKNHPYTRSDRNLVE